MKPIKSHLLGAIILHVVFNPARSLCVSVLFCVCRNITLLHYLITILEKQYPKVLMFQEDLQSISEAAKVK